MSPNCRKAGILALVIALGAAASVRAQDCSVNEMYQVGDLQFFAKPEGTPYSGEPVANEGFFGSYDVIIWAYNAPDRAVFGQEGQTRLVFRGTDFELQQNSHDTGLYESLFRRGDRVELGYMADGNGILLSAFKLKSAGQDIWATDVDMVFDDPFGVLAGFIDVETDGTVTLPDQVDPPGPGDGIDDDIDRDRTFGRDGRDLGSPNDTPPPDFIPPLDGELDPFPIDFDDQVPLPVTFQEVNARLETQLWGVEAMRVWRNRSVAFGGWLELAAGLRYMNFEEAFKVFANGDPADVPTDDDTGEIPRPGSLLADSRWSTKADNAILGPQFGVRWFNKWEYWTHSVDFKFAPSLNYQSVRQQGVLGDDLVPGNANGPTTLGPRGFNNTFHETEFSPVVELRLQSSYKLTRAIAARAGYNIIYTDGIARPSTMVRYSIERMGILTDRNTQDVFVHGFFIGLEVNR